MNERKAFIKRISRLLMKKKKLVVNEEAMRVAKKDRRTKKTIGRNKIHYDY